MWERERGSSDAERRHSDRRFCSGEEVVQGGRRCVREFWRGAASRRPPLRVRPPLGRWGVARRFACPKPSKAGLCPWPQVTGTDCAGALKEMISRVLENLPVFRLPAHSRG